MNWSLSIKETFMLGLGLALMLSLYQLKTGPEIFAPVQPVVKEVNQPVSEPTVVEPTLPETVIEQVQVPEWLSNKDEYDLAGLTVDDLWQFAVQAHESDHDFFPEQQNALFYLLQAQKAGLNTPESQTMMTTLQATLYAQADEAMAAYDDEKLTELTARLKTIRPDDSKIQQYTQRIGTIITLKRLAQQAEEQLNQNTIQSPDRQDLIRTIQSAEQIDPNFPAILNTKNQAVTRLTELAYQSAIENDYEMAEEHLELAQLIDPIHPETTATKAAITDQKQQRFSYLDQQFDLAINRLNLSRASSLLSDLAALDIQSVQLQNYQAVLDKTHTFGHLSPFDKTNDQLLIGTTGPTLVVMPNDSYTMGNDQGPAHQRPAHLVQFSHAFAIGQTEITVGQFKQFVDSSGYITTAESNHVAQVYDSRSGRIKNKHGINWRHDYMGKRAEESLPVIHVSFDDAKAYTQWLAQQTGQPYRLPSESEYEWALGMGNASTYPWGHDEPVQAIGNFSGAKDRLKRSRVRWREGFADYQDGHWGPAPVGSFIPNLFQVHDLSGNVMEWVDDCWHDSYRRAPADGSSWVNPGCQNRVIRGGHWASAKSDYQINHRIKAETDYHDPRLGFRVAKSITVQ